MAPKRQRDLDSDRDQQEILNPDPFKVKLSYETIQVYPFSAQEQRAALGLVYDVIARGTEGAATAETIPDAETAEHREARLRRAAGIFGLRIVAILNKRQNRDLTQEVFRLAAVSTGKPGTVSDEQAAAITAEFDSKCNGDDVVTLYANITDRSGFKEERPKNG